MSKWTGYQWLIVLGMAILIVLNNVFATTISKAFVFISRWVPPDALIVFFTIILIVWGGAMILLCQVEKGKPVFTHKLWRIMPAIIGVLLLLSLIVFLILGTTILTDLSEGTKWLIDVSIIYFLSLFYLFVLSVFIRYSNFRSNKRKILTSANTTVLILIFVILFLPAI